MPTEASAGLILVVDDHAMSLELAKESLTLDGFAVLTASSAAAGLALAARERPALILMDLHFAEGMNGLEATRRLKADPVTAHIPVVALTALGQPQAKLEAGDVRFSGYLTKPLDVPTLSETVRRFVTAVSE